MYILINSKITYLLPPGLSSSTEIFLSPGSEGNNSSIIDITVGKCKRQGSRSSYNGSGRSVLRSVTWAHELVVGGRPRYDTSQVSAHSVKSVRLKVLVLLHDEVGGISLKSLGKGSVSNKLGGKVVLCDKVVSEGILGGTSATASSSRWGEEEVDVGKS